MLFVPSPFHPSPSTRVSYRRVITQAGNHLALSVIFLNARQCYKKTTRKKGNPAGLFSPSCLVWGLSLIMRMRGGHYCGGISVSVWQKGATQLTKLAPNLWLPEQMEEEEKQEACSQFQAVRGGLRGLNTLWSQPGVNQPLRSLTNHSLGTTPLE